MSALSATEPLVARPAFDRYSRSLPGKRYNAPPPPFGGPLTVRTVREPQAVLFRDRVEAGRRLAEALRYLDRREETIVLAVPGGGAPVAAEVSQVLGFPLDIWLSGKLQPRGCTRPVGSISEDGDLHLDEELFERLRITPAALVEEIRLRRNEVRVKAILYRAGGSRLDLHGKQVIVIDDGVATGSTIQAVLKGVARSRPSRTVLASPIVPMEQMEKLSEHVDETAVLATPEGFRSVGEYYMHFRKVTDDEIARTLRPLDFAAVPGVAT